VDNLGGLLVKALVFVVVFVILRELLKRGGGGSC
jgi:hypothetical protein